MENTPDAIHEFLCSLADGFYYELAVAVFAEIPARKVKAIADMDDIVLVSDSLSPRISSKALTISMTCRAVDSSRTMTIKLSA
jgi:hypothetical protein